MKMMHLLIGAALLVPGPLIAQPNATNGERPRTAEPLQTFDPLIAAPADRVLDFHKGGSVSLDVSEEESELTFGYNWAANSRRVGDTSLRMARDTLGIELSLPIGGGDNVALRETLDGLRDGPAISFAWTRFQARSADRLDSPAFRRIHAIAMERCRAGLAARQHDTNCELHESRPTRDFAIRHSGLPEGRINQTLLSAGLAYGLEARLGINRFEYRTPLTLAKNSEQEPQLSLRGYFSFLPDDAMSMFTVSAEYQNDYEAPDAEILCPDVVTAPNDDCVSAVPAPPDHVERLLIGADYRQVIGSMEGIGQLAIGPMATVDALSGDFELELLSTSLRKTISG